MQRGFTLVELMIVVAIIGVAGALAAFNMADQVKDARAAADVRTVFEELRKEHRVAREQMLGLKVTSTGHVITFQSTRGPQCKDVVGNARVRTHDHATLSILVPAGVLCLNDRGELDTGTNGVGPPPSGLAAPTTVAAEPVLTIKANLSGTDRMIFTALRFERSGISEIRTLKTTTGSVANIEGALSSSFASTAAILAGPLKGALQTTPPGPPGPPIPLPFPAPLPPAPPQCPDPDNGDLVTCVSLDVLLD